MPHLFCHELPTRLECTQLEHSAKDQLLSYLTAQPQSSATSFAVELFPAQRFCNLARERNDTLNPAAVLCSIAFYVHVSKTLSKYVCHAAVSR